MPRSLKKNDVTSADEYFLQTFDYPLLAGKREGLLSTPNEVVLTKKLADKFFGETYYDQYEELLGKTLLIKNSPYQISGVLQDVPRNTNVTFRMLLPVKAFEENNPWVKDNWDNLSSQQYAFVTLPEGANPGWWEAQLETFKQKYHSEEQASKKTYYLQALSGDSYRRAV